MHFWGRLSARGNPASIAGAARDKLIAEYKHTTFPSRARPTLQVMWVVGQGVGGGLIDAGGGVGTIIIIQEAVSYKNPESGNLEIRIPSSLLHSRF